MLVRLLLNNVMNMLCGPFRERRQHHLGLFRVRAVACVALMSEGFLSKPLRILAAFRGGLFRRSFTRYCPACKSDNAGDAEVCRRSSPARNRLPGAPVRV